MVLAYPVCKPVIHEYMNYFFLSKHRSCIPRNKLVLPQIVEPYSVAVSWQVKWISVFMLFLTKDVYCLCEVPLF